MFQSTLPRGERPYTNKDGQKVYTFQSTLPRGERPIYIYFPAQLRRFNPRSHEGSDWNIRVSIWHLRSFNPRSHEGSDHIQRISKQLIRVSIHAPTRGATFSPFFFSPTPQFQSTLPRGERRQSLRNPDAVNLVSIHAPTRGATKTYFKELIAKYVSIHAPTRGATFSFWFKYL